MSRSKLGSREKGVVEEHLLGFFRMCSSAAPRCVFHSCVRVNHSAVRQALPLLNAHVVSLASAGDDLMLYTLWPFWAVLGAEESSLHDNGVGCKTGRPSYLGLDPRERD